MMRHFPGPFMAYDGERGRDSWKSEPVGLGSWLIFFNENEAKEEEPAGCTESWLMFCFREGGYM
jgi:hypothetical protein